MSGGATPITPAAATVNKDVLKALKQSGFPDVEAPANPSAMVTKVVAAIQKRLNKLDEFCTNISKIHETDRTDLMNKTLGRTHYTSNAGHFCFSFPGCPFEL